MEINCVAANSFDDSHVAARHYFVAVLAGHENVIYSVNPKDR